MAEVRTSSQSERPCAAIEETRTASADAGGSKDPGQRKVHSLIDKVYAPANLAEAWRHVRDNKGGAGIDGLTIDAFADREEERLAALHRKLRDRSYRPSPVKRVGIPKPDGGVRKLGIPSVTDRVVQQALVQKDGSHLRTPLCRLLVRVSAGAFAPHGDAEYRGSQPDHPRL